MVEECLQNALGTGEGETPRVRMDVKISRQGGQGVDHPCWGPSLCKDLVKWWDIVGFVSIIGTHGGLGW